MPCPCTREELLLLLLEPRAEASWDAGAARCAAAFRCAGAAAWLHDISGWRGMADLAALVDHGDGRAVHFEVAQHELTNPRRVHRRRRRCGLVVGIRFANGGARDCGARGAGGGGSRMRRGSARDDVRSWLSVWLISVTVVQNVIGAISICPENRTGLRVRSAGNLSSSSLSVVPTRHSNATPDLSAEVSA
jgi:hypothetical protein